MKLHWSFAGSSNEEVVATLFHDDVVALAIRVSPAAMGTLHAWFLEILKETEIRYGTHLRRMEQEAKP